MTVYVSGIPVSQGIGCRQLPTKGEVPKLAAFLEG